MKKPFRVCVSMSRSAAAEWSKPHACYAIDYLGQAEMPRFPFGAKRYRVWIVPATPELREKWRAA